MVAADHEEGRGGAEPRQYVATLLCGSINIFSPDDLSAAGTFLCSVVTIIESCPLISSSSLTLPLAVLFSGLGSDTTGDQITNVSW